MSPSEKNWLPPEPFESVESVDVLVIGGGAAGFFGAIRCAELNSLHRVVLLEASRQPLAKVRISGGGRCNVTHACFEPAALVQHYPRGGKALRGAFTRFQPRDTIAWFEQRGVRLKTEADGRMFPTTDDSETIVTCLQRAAQRAGVQVRVAAPVTTVDRDSQGFTVQLKSGQWLQSRSLLLATGSSATGYRLAQRLGHQIEPPVPSLFTFTIPDPALRALAGVAVAQAEVQLRVSDGGAALVQTAPLLITHWGLSGPAILKLSAWAARQMADHHYQAALQINWLPTESASTLRQQLLDTKTNWGKRSLATQVPVPVPRRLWHYLLERSGLDANLRWADLSKAGLAQLLQSLTQSHYTVQGKGAFKDEFVTCGGVRLKEVDFKTMMSRCCPGLYLAGEVLDIDGVTGGFNFQSAWTTGWIAGQAIGQG